MYGGQTLVKELYMDGHNKCEECTGTDITSERNVQWTFTSERIVHGVNM